MCWALVACATSDDEPETVAVEQHVAVTFANIVNANAVGNSLVKTAGGSNWNAGARSVETVTGDGFLEFTTGEKTRAKTAGLSSSSDASQTYLDPDFSILLGANGIAQVYEFGLAIAGTTTPYAANDVFRVEAVEHVVRYYRNGALFFTSSKLASSPLYVDTALFHVNATLDNVQLSNFVFKDVVNVNVVGNTLTKTGAAGDGTSGVASVRAVRADTGFAEFSSAESNLAKVAGLSNSNPNALSGTILFGVSLRATGEVQVLESGIVRGTFGTYVANDVFRVAVNNSNQIQYSKNSVVFFTSPTTPTYPLFLDVSLIDVGATLTGVSLNDTFWTNLVGADGIGNSLFDISGTSGTFNAGGVSVVSITNDGFVEFTTNENGKAKALGLSNGDTNQDLPDIDFGILMGANASIEIRENNIKRTIPATTYVPGDVFRIAVINNVVTYHKNGTLLFTSSKTPTFPLLVDTALRDTIADSGSTAGQGSTFKDVVFTQTGQGPVPRDPISGFAVPITQTDWNAVFAAAGVAPKTVSQSWALQDSSGDPTATIGTPLTASTGVAALDYQQAVTGWQRRSINFAPDGGAEFMFQIKAIGPDPTIESVLSFGYIGMTANPAATRRVMTITGSAGTEVLLSMTNAGNYRIVCANAATLGTAVATGPVRPMVLQYNRSASQFRAYSNQEIISGAFSTGITNSTKGLGMANGSGTTGPQQNLLATQFRGADAEWTEAEMRAVYNVLLPTGSTVPW